MPLEKSAGAIVFRKEKEVLYYLLLHSELGHWGFPKGNIEKGESLTGTIKREVKEETGIKDIEFISNFKETIKYFYKREGKNIFKTVVFFLTETKTKDIKISWEHVGFEWLSYNKAFKKITFKNSKQILKKANDYLLLRGKGEGVKNRLF